MTKSLTHRPLGKRLLAGLTAGLIVGALLGMAIAFRLIQINDSLHTPFLQSQLRLHMAALYALLLLIPGLIVGAVLVGRRRQVGLVAHGIICLAALLVFYYGRNWLSYHIWTRFGGLRIPLEVFGFIGWAAACWVFYKILLFLEEAAKGWTVRIALAAIVILGVWSAYHVMVAPSDSSAIAAELVLPAPKQNVKVAVIGIDGAWWEVMDPLMDNGQMPVFKSLVDRGVRSQCHTLLPTLSAPIWNTIATGKNPDKHHITSFTVWTFPVTHAVLPLTRYPIVCYELEWMLGSVIGWTPMNSTFRMSEAIWNILSRAGLTVGVMNWWASYPAEPVNGFVVTDYALYNKTLQYILGADAGDDPQSVFPPQLLPEITPYVIDPQNLPADSVVRFINFKTEADRAWYENTKDYRVFAENSEAAMFKFSYPEDETMVRAAIHLLKTETQPDFFAIYLDGLDSMEHKYLPYYFYHRHQDALKPENIARLKDLVPNYYLYLDEVMGRFLQVLDPKTYIIIVSDHGFNHGMEANGNYNHPNAPPGVFVIAGDGIKKGEAITTASVRDVVPTVLQLFELPVGRDMDGRVLTEAFDMRDLPVTWVETYDTEDRSRGRVEPKALDKALQERLKALGYTK
jgi:predicted AlkP superfamily phosphohydrolase/phosphomutase